MSNSLSVAEVAAAQTVSEEAAQSYINDKRAAAIERVRELEETVARLEHRML